MSDVVDIWLVDTDEVAAAWPGEAIAHDWLAPSERARAEHFATAHARRRYIVSLWCARVLLAAAGVPDVRAGEFRRNANGKPFVPDGPQFNLSRSDRLAIIAMTPETSIGIDIERIRNVSIPPDWRQRFPAVAAAITVPPPLPGDNTQFLRAWTRLEASLKCAGAALAPMLDEPAVHGSHWLPWQANSSGCLRDLDPADGFVAALAAARDVKVRFRRLDNAAILLLA